VNALVPKNADHVIGVLSGWDRLVFRGTLRMLAYAGGMAAYLSRIGTLLKDFGDHAQAMTEQLIQASLERAEAAGRPVQYLQSPSIRKDDYARRIAKTDGITDGLICVLTCVEPCRSFEIYRNREKKLLELVARNRKCKFLYHYWIDRRFGFMSARVQTWFPFPLQVCMNGREWLARRMDEKGMSYTRYDNSFPRIEDFSKAQKMLDGMQKTDWPKMLDAAARQVHPAHAAMFRGLGFRYYWSAFQTEWATDTAFDSPKALAAIYPQLVRGAIATFDSRNVMRFLGHRLYENHEGQITSDYRHRPEGVCVKHRAVGNSIKVYDKGGTILRIETTINNPEAYRSYRSSETEPEGDKQWRVMRRGVADMYRRAEVSQAANDRYAEALASLDTTTPLGYLATMVCRPVSKNGKRYRALHPFSSDDRQLLEAISDGTYATGGFCNRDLASRLYPKALAHPTDRARTASKVSYRLRILRAHGLIRKLPGQRRYHMTTKGRQIVTALLQVQHATLQQLNAIAA
jgi:hypothetical protein